jgi:hypothetical protein
MSSVALGYSTSVQSNKFMEAYRALTLYQGYIEGFDMVPTVNELTEHQEKQASSCTKGAE